MTACMTLAVQGFSCHCNIQSGSRFSGCQGLLAMGTLIGWELTSHLWNFLFLIILFFVQTFAIWHFPMHISSQKYGLEN
jgi:hypothetical protein